MNDSDEDAEAEKLLQHHMDAAGASSPPTAALLAPAALYLTAILECVHLIYPYIPRELLAYPPETHSGALVPSSGQSASTLLGPSYMRCVLTAVRFYLLCPCQTCSLERKPRSRS